MQGHSCQPVAAWLALGRAAVCVWFLLAYQHTRRSHPRAHAFSRYTTCSNLIVLALLLLAAALPALSPAAPIRGVRTDELVLLCLALAVRQEAAMGDMIIMHQIVEEKGVTCLPRLPSPLTNQSLPAHSPTHCLLPWMGRLSVCDLLQVSLSSPLLLWVLFSDYRRAYVPVNTELAVERFSLIYIISLGEVVLRQASPPSHQPASPPSLHLCPLPPSLPLLVGH